MNNIKEVEEAEDRINSKIESILEQTKLYAKGASICWADNTEWKNTKTITLINDFIYEYAVSRKPYFKYIKKGGRIK